MLEGRRLQSDATVWNLEKTLSQKVAWVSYTCMFAVEICPKALVGQTLRNQRRNCIPSNLKQ